MNQKLSALKSFSKNSWVLRGKLKMAHYVDDHPLQGQKRYSIKIPTGYWQDLRDAFGLQYSYYNVISWKKPKFLWFYENIHLVLLCYNSHIEGEGTLHKKELDSFFKFFDIKGHEYTLIK